MRENDKSAGQSKAPFKFRLSSSGAKMVALWIVTLGLIGILRYLETPLVWSQCIFGALLVYTFIWILVSFWKADFYDFDKYT